MTVTKRTGIQVLLGVAGITVIRLYLRLFGRTVRCDHEVRPVRDIGAVRQRVGAATSADAG